MALFFQESIRARCVPGPGRAATDIEDLISRGGTVYLLGRDDPYASASPLMTAIAEHVLDTALHMATSSPYGRLCPSFLACLDELPSTTPLPTLRTRMANERALGLSFIYAAQTWRQLVICYGEDEARALFGLTNNILVFGGGKDGHFYREISELMGTARVARTTYSTGRGGWGKTTAGEDVPILRPEEIRQLPERQALVVSENARPLIAKLHRCIDGKPGKALLAAQRRPRETGSTPPGRRPQRGRSDPRRRRDRAPAGAALHRLTSRAGPMRGVRGEHQHRPGLPRADRAARQRVRAAADRPFGRRGSQEARSAALSELARPWDPASCPPLLRKELWVWLDRVAGWFNHEYTWQADRVIPSCWPAHPHIVHETRRPGVPATVRRTRAHR